MTKLIAAGLLCLSPAWAEGIRGTVKVAGARDSADVAVYLDKIPGKTFAPPKETVILDQVNLTFVPRVLPVLAGTTVGFPNSDEVRHNVFSPSPPKRFNLGTYPRGVSRAVTFDKPGEVALLCNVHAEMSAYVIVVETPYFAVSRKDGSFEIKDVPPGKYTLKTWHEKKKPVTAEVTVPKGAAAELQLTLK
ncbi:MAG: carboxypeptidase regulatory-like domain-containing protein [Acidobacteriota bacterium]